MLDKDDKIDESAVRLSESLNTSGLIAMTGSGQSAKKVARYRPSRTIFAVTHDCYAARSLTLVWGVVPAFAIEKEDIRDMIGGVIKQGLERGVLDREESYIMTAGDPAGAPGSTNLIRVITGHEMEFFLQRKIQKAIEKKALS